MKNIKIFIALFSIILIGISVYSCTKDIIADQKDEVKDNLALTSRSLGSFSVIDGRLYFPTIADYRQTISYLDNASEKEILAFRNSFNLETAAKVFDEFISLSGAMDSTSTGLAALEEAYAGKIRINTDSNGDKVYEPKYDINPELVNLQGEIGVSTTIFKYFDGKVISITNPSRVDLSTITENTTTNLDLGIFVSITESVSGPPCCPLSNDKNTMYDSEKKRKRIRINYWSVLWTEIFSNPYGSYRYVAIPRIHTEAMAISEFHKHVWFQWWWADYKIPQMKHELYHELSHDWSQFNIPSPLIINDSKTENDVAKIVFKSSTGGYYQTNGIIITANPCVNVVRQKGTRTSNGVFCEFNCSN